MSERNFADLDLSDEIKSAIKDVGYTQATDIQYKSIPIILKGADLIGHSQTGSGKTASFGLPALDLIDTDLPAKITQILILCPTRELALQASEELTKFAKYKKGIRIVPIFGGQSIDLQITLLRRGCQIVIGTPGRIMDHMRRRTLKLDNIKTVILDEADEMLNMGFREDIETILADTPDERQTILFSATMPKPIMDITKRFQKKPEIVKIDPKQMTVATIEQSYFEVARQRKNGALFLLIAYYKPSVSIVFCNTKRMVDELVAELVKKGFAAQGLHGDMKQAQRTHVMNRFKQGTFNVLVATDVAARGIDVNNVDIVFNYDLPDDDEYYVHRIGRTGRAGKFGRSFSLIQGMGQYRRLMQIANYTKSKIERGMLPLVSQIKDRNARALLENVRAYMEKHDCKKFKETLLELVDDAHDLETVACALFAMNIKKPPVKEDCGAAMTLNAGKEQGGGSRAGFKAGAGRRGAPVRARRETDADMAQVRISIGRKDGVAPNHILGAVAGESGLSGKLMGAINIGQTATTIDVPSKFKTNVIKSLNGKTIRGKKVTVS